MTVSGPWTGLFDPVLDLTPPIITISDEDLEDCESGCSDTECDSSMCNVNYRLGHVKCFKHMVAQRGKNCDSNAPCHRCRSRLRNDKDNKFLQHFLTCEKQRDAKRAQWSKSIPVDTVVILRSLFYWSLCWCIGLSVTINTAILTAEELETITKIVETAKQRDAAAKSQTVASNDSKLVFKVLYRSCRAESICTGLIALVYLQDAILSQLGNMSNRIDSVEAKGAGGPVLNQQPLQLPYSQFAQPYGYMPQMPMPPPPPGFGPGQSQTSLPHMSVLGQAPSSVPTPPHSGKGGDTSKDTVSPVLSFKLPPFS